jgi:starvation-inducible DNA-binding protein
MAKRQWQIFLNHFKVLLTKQRTLLTLSAEIDDEGTNAQMSDYIRAQEKLVWMYSAFLNS